MKYNKCSHNGRTDTLIVITVNPSTHKMSMLSIPRDTRVTIAGKDQEDKINSASVLNW